ncbi:MAG TPA: ABC transporter permease [Burkholderiaceae bacterium]|nr:ABC transporter permease [Burkholderiaceae bacterium]
MAGGGDSADGAGLRGGALVIPALLLVAAFLLAPLGLILRFSFDRFDPIKLMLGVFSPANYVQAFADPYYLGVLGITARIAALSTVIVMLMAFPVAYFISRVQSQRLRGWLIILTVLPLLLGNAVRSAAWMLVMGTKGVANSVMIGVGLIDEPLKILYTPTAVVIALVSVLLPFAIITLQSVMDSIPASLEEAGQSLGHSPLRTVGNVVLPLAMPGVIAAAAICFALAMNAYATPVLIGGPTMKMMGPVVYEQIAKANNWPFGSTLACLLMAVTLLLTVVSTRMLRRRYF